MQKDKGRNFRPYLQLSFGRRYRDKTSVFYITAQDLASITSTGEKADSVISGFRSENYSGSSGLYYGRLKGSTLMITRYDAAARIDLMHAFMINV
jgi:hypothetical protein